MLVVNKVNDGGPGIAVVNIVAKSGGVDDGQLDLEGFLLKFGFDDIDLYDEYQNENSGAMAKRTSVSLSNCLT